MKLGQKLAPVPLSREAFSHLLLGTEECKISDYLDLERGAEDCCG